MAAKRKAVSKRTRFEVFKRDRFTCQYCGRKPPEVVLQIDHVVPVSKGGDNASLNLLTACFDCNSGKSNVPLKQVIDCQLETLAEGKEKLAQLKAMQRFILDERKAHSKIVDLLIGLLFDGKTIPPNADCAIRRFIPLLPLDDLLAAADFTVSKGDEIRDCVSFFCSVCIGKIRRREAERCRETMP